jgi:hypothetical protein
MLLEPVQAEIIEAVANRHRQRCAEAQMQEEAATGSRPHEAPKSGKFFHPSSLKCGDDPINGLIIPLGCKRREIPAYR